MTSGEAILVGFCGDAVERSVYLPDLTLWYNWHESRETLPDRWREYTLADIARDLGVPVFDVARPWCLETGDVEENREERETERVATYQTSCGTLTARWTLGPDGDWWQTEHYVKTAGDLPAALELAGARSYTVDSTDLELARDEVGDDGVVAVEIPIHPYTDLLYDFLGMSEGPILLAEHAAEFEELMALLENSRRDLLAELVQLPATLFLAPDNLDAQFISPTTFEQWLVPAYSQTCELLHRHDKRLIVHTGGPIGGLLPSLRAAGIDAVEGICGPPQSDASLAQARELAGTPIVLWGGIAQDFLLETTDLAEFEAAVADAVAEAGMVDSAIIGVADRVPTTADLSRLEAIPKLIESAT